jgi:Rho GDP-dissociation inhibitor
MMSKTVSSWFARAGSSKSLPKESTLVKFSTVHPAIEDAKEHGRLGGNTNNSQGLRNEEIGNGNSIDQLKDSQKLLPEAAVPAATDALLSAFEYSDADEDQEEEEAANEEFLQLRLPELGPQVPLKEQLEKDKEDESLKRWKEQLLGGAAAASLEEAAAGGLDGCLNPEVKVLRLGIRAKGREELDLLQLLPLSTTANAPPQSTAGGGRMTSSFCLKEGCQYQLKFVFTVRNNIVPGLTCINTVWKAGFTVDQTRSMLGTFAPQQEPYVHLLPEQVTPCGLLARGCYTARKRFVDDDGTVYLDVNYSFEIRKDW